MRGRSSSKAHCPPQQERESSIMAAAGKLPDLSGAYKWEKLPELPTGRVYAVGGYHDGKLYVLGRYYTLYRVAALNILIIFRRV